MHNFLASKNKILLVVFYCSALILIANGDQNETKKEEEIAHSLSLNITSKVPTSPIQKIPVNTVEKTTEIIPEQPSTISSSTLLPKQTTIATISTKQNEEPQDEKTPGSHIHIPEIEITDNCLGRLPNPKVDNLTQDEFTNRLTDSCRYDRLIKPTTSGAMPVNVQIDMKHIESSDQLQFKAHLLVQLHYRDHRLNYSGLSPHRGNILGEEPLRNKIWVPHIIVYNEKQSGLMGIDGKDVYVQITPAGEVIYSYRMTTTFYCWMNLQKFPFDYQICEIKWVSWAYDKTHLVLQWSASEPFQVASNLHLTEFVLEKKWTEQTDVEASFHTGGLSGNYSAVVFKFKIRREVGYYIMDYFLPSMLLVCTSWVTFWLQADASAPRVTLGTATMLSFITLNGGLSKNLPKVSYIKASEIWFLACASFIFLSMAEFAFVNVIWRRKKKVELKKQNSKHILKGAITPSLARKQLRKAESINSLYKTRSCSSLNEENNARNTQANYLTVHSFPSSLNVPTITTQSQDDLMCSEDSVTTIPIPDNASRPPTPPAWTTMTPHEVANWIDKKSRIAFPVAFLVFNLFYWSFVYAL